MALSNIETAIDFSNKLRFQTAVGAFHVSSDQSDPQQKSMFEDFYGFMQAPKNTARPFAAAWLQLITRYETFQCEPAVADHAVSPRHTAQFTDGISVPGKIYQIIMERSQMNWNRL